MAMFETEGYCPANLIEQKARELGKTEVLEELGSRHLWMVYPDGCAADGPYVVDLLFSESVGTELTDALREAIPRCKYPESTEDMEWEGKKVEIHDTGKAKVLSFCDVVVEKEGIAFGLFNKRNGSIQLYVAKEVAA